MRMQRKRVNIRKIVSLDEMISKPYSEVTIELTENFKIEEIKKFFQIMERLK